ncbi:hypothetical protein [Haloplanus natans]|uniref:hypothetical protein n=1 Tax=Haloplanus natans TaxID=376171 RepID=UPI0012FA1D8E|nr:hypothetical protein [Haloplanus natans]
MNSKTKTTVLLSAFLLAVSTAAAATPTGPETGPSEVPGDRPEQFPGNVTPKNQTGPFSMIPGIGNRTLPSMPELPDPASAVVKSVTGTIDDAFNSVTGFAGGIGSFLSENLPVIGGAEKQTQPVNGTNSTRR